MAVLGPGDALLVADIQNDLLSGGALGAAGGDTIFPALRFYLGRFQDYRLSIFLTRDRHPPVIVPSKISSTKGVR